MWFWKFEHAFFQHVKTMPDPPQTEVQFFLPFGCWKKSNKKKRQNDCGVTFHCFFGGDTGVLICRNSFGSIPTIGKQFAKTNENYCLFGINVPEFTQSCHREVQNEVNIFFFPPFFFFLLHLLNYLRPQTFTESIWKSRISTREKLVFYFGDLRMENMFSCQRTTKANLP